MHQSTIPSLPLTFWPGWESRQFVTLPIVEALLPVTFGYSLSSWKTLEAVEMKEAVTKVIDTLTQEEFHEAFQKLLERYNKCIETGGDYFEGDYSFMCVLSIKVPIQKRSGNLFNDARIYIYIYIYVVIHRQICFVLSELISVARQYLTVAGIETWLSQTSNQSF